MVGNDPFPIGVNANREALETIIKFAVDQHIIPRKVNPEELFPPSTPKLE